MGRIDPDTLRNFEVIAKEKQALKEKQERVESIRAIIQGYSKKNEDTSSSMAAIERRREDKFKLKTDAR